MTASDSRPSAQARHKLIEAGIVLFGRKGLEGTSIREIARLAGVNIAGIAYHFGGKDRLYLACAEHIAKTVLSGVNEQLRGAKSGANSGGSSPAAALKSTLRGAAEFMLARPEIGDLGPRQHELCRPSEGALEGSCGGAAPTIGATLGAS